MKQFLLTMAGVFAGLVLFFIGVPILLVASIASSAKPAPTPSSTILSLDLRQALSDQEPQSPFSIFQGRSLSIVSTVEALRQAEHDSRVKGLLVRLPEGGLSPAAADELAGAIRAFHASGKPVIAHSQGIYPSGFSTAAYMLGAASGQFWMQPSSSLQSVGVATEETFFKRAFDKYGVKADYEQRYQYKNAVNPFLYDDFTPAHREAELGWMGSIYDTELQEAAADRKMTPAALKGVLEAGPYSAEDAAAKKLIDHVGQEHEAEAALKASTDSGAKLIDLASYKAGTFSTVESDSTVAVIGAEGEITTGTARQTFGSSSGVHSDDIAKAFYDAIDDKAVKAILFRVSSPGGSDTASEQILAALKAAKAAGKPVVVSMGTYAASGGYWISSQASEIVAEPTTLTGSIGVFGGKFVIGPALAKFGIDTRGLGVGGDYASAFGSASEFTPAQRAQFSVWMDHIYAGFVGRVAVGRHLSPDRVQEIAKGRVWTGVQAKNLGLVDKLGGFYVAAAEAKRLAGIPASTPVALKSFPAHKSFLASLQQAMGASVSSVRTLAVAAEVLGDPRAQGLIEELARAHAGVQNGTVLAPQTIR